MSVFNEATLMQTRAAQSWNGVIIINTVSTAMNTHDIQKVGNCRLFKPIQIPIFSGLYLGSDNQSGLRNQESKKNIVAFYEEFFLNWAKNGDSRWKWNERNAGTSKVGCFLVKVEVLGI